MSENKKNYKLIRVAPTNILFTLHPVSNMALQRQIFLTDTNTQQALPEDWALGVFQDDSIYTMYKKGLFTFDDNESLAKAAFEAGVYFDDKLDFTPAKPTRANDILLVLKSGNRASILKTIDDYGKDAVIDVVIKNINNLTQGVINMLESTLGMQFTVEEE